MKYLPPLLALVTLLGFGSLRADDSPLAWSVRLADSEIARLGDKLTYPNDPKFDYAANLFALSLLKLSQQTGDTHYAAFAERSIGSFVTPEGKLQGYKADDYSLDNINGGMLFLALLERTGDQRYRKAIDELRAQLRTQPRTSDGGFWHKGRYQNQMWLDGLDMAEPFYAAYGKTFGEKAVFGDVAKQFRLIAAHTGDPKTGLYYHGWDETRSQSWANQQTGTSASFWSRGMGWLAMGLVDTLDSVPAEHAAKAELAALLNKLAAAVKYQDTESGLWWQVTDQGTRAGNYREASASAMFAYALAKGVYAGYLPHSFADAATKAFAGLVRSLVKTDAQGAVSLAGCCKVAGLGQPDKRDGSFAYYVSEPVVENDLKGVGPFILAGLELARMDSPAPPPTAAHASSETAGWKTVPEILARVAPPAFPAKDFPITNFGAVGDGTTDCSDAIRKAIDACAQAGGGRVVVPAGKFLTGAIHLKSNVNLHVSEGATVLFKTDPAAYLPAVFTRWEGVECLNYSPLIYAFGQENVAVTGKGTLDGRSDNTNWWRWNPQNAHKASPQKPDRDELNTLSEQGVPPEKRIFGEGHFLRPNFIQPYRCKNVLIEGVTILRSPMWEIHPVLCANVTVRGVSVHSHGPNNDGCDPECCRDVLIEDCTFDTGDDCLAIKSGRNNDGRRVGVASENIVIRRCTMQAGHGGVVIGSEISGDCRNVFAEDCKMDSPDLTRALRLKSNAQRGGVIENIYLRNTTVGQVSGAVVEIDFNYEEGEKGTHPPVVRHVVVENVTCRKSKYALNLQGYATAPIRDVRLVDCTFSDVANEDIVKNVVGLEKVNVKIETGR